MKEVVLKVVILSILVSTTSFAQRCPPPRIGKTSPSKIELENLLEKRSLIAGHQRVSANGIVKIPVVVHVIHNNTNGAIGGTANQNISNEQIFSQIKVLNEDYRREANTPGFNNSPIGVDMGVEFYLATIDPNGQPTSGITRNYVNKASWNIAREQNQIANVVTWDSNKYLNIWVLNLSSTLIGYAEFPGASIDGLELNDANESIDGVYINYKNFGRQTGTATDGPYSDGRTATHEIGHWLGLIHIWGDSNCGDDYCNDTPVVEDANLNTNCSPKFSTCTGRSVRAMIENYMDYSADECMNIFTADQKARTRAVFELSQRRRRLVLNAEQFLPPVTEFSFKLISHPSTKEEMKLQVLLPDFQDFTVNFYDNYGRLRDSKTFRDYPSTVIPFTDFSRLVSGQVYIMQVISGEKIYTDRVLLF